MSNINPQNIDGTFPIAGQDNNSQGFRDNFTNTVNNFSFAAQELTDLQNNAILKAPLSSVGQTSLNNNLNNAQLIYPQLLQTTYTIDALTTPSGNIALSWASGHYQTVTINSATALTFDTSWPTGYWTYIRLALTVTSGPVALTLPAAVSVNTSNIGGASGQTITLPNGIYAFEFATPDGGTTITIRDLLRSPTQSVMYTNVNYVTANTATLTASLSTTSSDNFFVVQTANPVITINMPANPINGQVCRFGANANVGYLVGTGTVSPSFLGNNTSIGGSYRYVYNSTYSAWFKQ